MSPLVALRPDLQALAGYHSPQVEVEVRLNTNESPYPPPEAWRQEYARALGALDFNRYPDRDVAALRQALARHHQVAPEEVFCANGSNEVLQCLLLAYGGAGRQVVTFEPTYALHRHIAQLTGTEVVSAPRRSDFTLAPEVVHETLGGTQAVLAFLCSPNNPTGRAEPPETIVEVLGGAPGLVVVDEAYGQFARRSALELRRTAAQGARTLGGARVDPRRLVVVRTFSKTWSMAGVRLGYLVADPEVVAACQQVALPYHLSATTQVAGLLALKYEDQMRQRVARITEERGRVAAALADLGAQTWPSDANFVLFRPLGRPATEVWSALLDRSVLVRDCSSWPSLEGCLRVSIGTPEENDRFLASLEECLR